MSVEELTEHIIFSEAAFPNYELYGEEMSVKDNRTYRGLVREHGIPVSWKTFQQQVWK